MSFWQTRNGKEVDGSERNTFESSFSLIPDGTTAPAIITKFEYREYDNSRTGSKDRMYQITWKLIGGDFANRQVWQKLYPFDHDADKQARNLNMMKRIFMLANFELNHDDAPSTEDLYPLINKQMGIKIRVWQMEGKEGNRVSEVHSLDNNFVIETGKSIEITHIKKQSNNDNMAAYANGASTNGIPDFDLPF